MTTAHTFIVVYLYSINYLVRYKSMRVYTLMFSYIQLIYGYLFNYTKVMDHVDILLKGEQSPKLKKNEDLQEEAEHPLDNEEQHSQLLQNC